LTNKIDITPSALEALESITDRRTRNVIIRRIDALAEEPPKLGKSLRGLLAGFLSIRAAGQRFRVVYKIDDKKERVVIYMVGRRQQGSRHDVYELVEHLVRRGLI
jgi:mRNA interferase RelE/StbE